MTDREKIYNEFPKEYNFAVGSNNRFVLDVHLNQIDELHDTIEQIYNILDIKNCTGIYLDRLGDFVGIKRKAYESDKSYRKRILISQYEKIDDTTIQQLSQVLQTLVEDKTDIYIFKEGIYPSDEAVQNDLESNFKIYKGDYTNNFFSTNSEVKEVKFKTKGGYIYIALNQRISAENRQLITEILNTLKAAGVKLIIDFKYKITTSSYAMGVSMMNTFIQQDLTNYLFDNVVYEDNYQTNANAVNTEMWVRKGE